MTLNRIIKGVLVDYTGYIAAWGKAPRGRGGWAFFWGSNGQGEAHWHNGTLPEACRAAATEAAAAGVHYISVGS